MLERDSFTRYFRGRILTKTITLLLLLLSCVPVFAQSVFLKLPTVAGFQVFSKEQPRISQEAVPIKPFSVVGPRGALLGQQNGSYEAWIFPWKIFNGIHLTVNMQNYPVPIDANQHAAWIDVQPYATTITYSHANFTIRQIMLAPKVAPVNDGVLVLYQFEAVRPMTITISFNPVMRRMWPANSPDTVSPEWVATKGGSGFYILHLPLPEHAAALAMPDAEPGIMVPYQESEQNWPLQFVLHYDPQKDRGKFYPLLVSLGNGAQNTSAEAFYQSLATLDRSAQNIFNQNQIYYHNLLANHTQLITPDPRLNQAFSWAETAIDQLRVKTTPGEQEQALTAGFVRSGDSTRPGFGWFFGRDALWTLYAVDSYGGFTTAKQEIDFLLKRQRADGKIMHEYSQTADLVDWSELPYEYASADSTPLLLMATNDYYTVSGDKDFIATHWTQFDHAWRYETTHDSSDGIYNNGSGTGWVESWIPKMPAQEIYLALLDEQASRAFANLASATGHASLAHKASLRAESIGATIEREYNLPRERFYAFSHNADGTVDKTPTIFPAVAWWSYASELPHAESMLSRWASSEFSTDWGSRILSDKVSFYDPISYHQGSVWPLFTGWLSVAEYRGGNPLAGYASLMQNVNLTWAQDPGDVTELLSGRFYQVLGRSTAHQLWSSAMVISPILRGMFGLAWNEPENRLSVTPHLPANWSTATIKHLPYGQGFIDLHFIRHGDRMIVTPMATGCAVPMLASHTPGAKWSSGYLSIPLPAVEAYVDQHLPAFGAETSQLKVLNEQRTAHSYILTLAAPAGTSKTLELWQNLSGIKLRAIGAQLSPEQNRMRKLTVDFQRGSGYEEKTIQILW